MSNKELPVHFPEARLVLSRVGCREGQAVSPRLSGRVELILSPRFAKLDCTKLSRCHINPWIQVSECPMSSA